MFPRVPVVDLAILFRIRAQLEVAWVCAEEREVQVLLLVAIVCADLVCQIFIFDQVQLRRVPLHKGVQLPIFHVLRAECGDGLRQVLQALGSLLRGD